MRNLFLKGKDYKLCDEKKGKGIKMNNEMKKLMKSKSNKTICGVCGGIGNYLNVDPTVIRLLWIVFSFLGGSGILAYVIAAIIMPEE